MHLVSYLPRFLEDPGGENLDFQTFLSLNKWVRTSIQTSQAWRFFLKGLPPIQKI